MEIGVEQRKRENDIGGVSSYGPMRVKKENRKTCQKSV
jgi:hypothetical protein